MRYSLIIILTVFLTPANANNSQKEQQDMVILGESLLGCVSAMSQSFDQTPFLAIDDQGRTITIQLKQLYIIAFELCEYECFNVGFSRCCIRRMRLNDLGICFLL